MVVVTDVSYGNIRGATYYFEKAGDLIPMHNHNQNSAHITIVTSGSIKHISLDKALICPIGSVLNCDDDIMHEIRALEDNTCVLNILKYPVIETAEAIVV